ncbi:MAG: tetratricopeptide repeat protein [Myxococcota bacterium]
MSLYHRALEAVGGVAGARLATRAAELLLQLGQNDEAIRVLRRVRNVEDAPVRAAARLALAVGAYEVAIELLAGSDLEEDRVERARLLVSAGRVEEALPLLMDLLSTAEGTVGVAARASSVAEQVGDTQAMIRAYAAIARQANSEPLRVGYASWTAMQLQAMGRTVEATEYWLIARELRPASSMALDGAVRGAVQRREPERIRTLFRESRPDAPMLLVDALVTADATEEAVEVLQEHVESLRASGSREAQLGPYVELERLQCAVGDWQGAYDALVERRELCLDPTVRARADAARRWLLAQKLADTDAAWDMYRQLHEDAPYDRQVTDALARIAALRGETDTAIGYLDELASAAEGPVEAARYRCRIGEIQEKAGNASGARKAYVEALEQISDHRQALDGLRRLAEQAGDWPGLIAVLQREEKHADVARQIELRRQVAQVTEDKLQDRKAAMQAWRALLQIDPGDREALAHQLDLAEALGEWQIFVETGDQLVQQLTSRERATLLRKMGVVCQDRLSRNDAVRYYEQAVAIKPPDHEAAARLEGLARGRADWPGVVRALRLQADADVEPDRRVEALLKAARIEIEALHDKEAGAACYAQVLELRPNHEMALRFMSNYLYETKRFEEALPICVRLEPMLQQVDELDDFDTLMDLSTFFYFFGEILRNRGDEDEALPRYEKALALNPSHLPSLEAVGPLYMATEQWGKGEKVFRQLLQLSGGHGEKSRVAAMYTSLGLVERQLGNPDKAYKRFSKALEIYPNHVGALKGMALVLEDRQDWSNLLNVYNNVIYHATVPDDVVDAYMTKGRILDDQMQRQDKAAQHYQRTLDLDPNQPGAYLRLAELAMRRDAYAEAGEFAERALQLDTDLVKPLRPLLLVLRAATWHAAGRTPEAERCLREARMLDPQLMKALGDLPLQDLERMRRVIKEHLPR